VGDAKQLCPSCAGQITAGTESCPWCGAGLASAEATRVATAPPIASALAPDEDLATTRPLPTLPPPPKSLPLVALNPTQVFLRAVIVLGAMYVLFVIGREVVRFSACAVPSSPLCN